MDFNLHQKKGIEHLTKVLQYYPMIQEGQTALVGLTTEDWHVVCDTLFHMNTPREALPTTVKSVRLSKEGDKILVETNDCTITIESF